MSDAIKPWGSSKSNRPEDQVRRDWLQKMELELGYPRGLMLVEKELNALPHVQKTSRAPNRRFDIISLAKDLHPHHTYYPLLLVECKADTLSSAVVGQVAGYNRFVKSLFIGLANRDEFYLGRYDANSGEYLFSLGLPPFLTLYEEALSCFTKI